MLADHKGACKDCRENRLAYTAGSRAPNHLDAWEHRFEYRSGRWAQTDYNFETPAASLLTGTDTLIDLPGVRGYELFDYPGEYQARAHGAAHTRVRMEEEEIPHEVVVGGSRCCTFTPGGKFTVEEHDVAAEAGRSYVLTAVQHAARDSSYGAKGQGAEYGNTFTCIPATALFRPARRTPKPFVQGPQTAVVVGPQGEEIYTDKYGRVKVQFHWDRYGKRDENSSCWIRVAEGWAGKNWGSLSLPRIGQEVVVDFLEGDPNRPLITGRVYNAAQMQAYKLPDEKTKSYTKSNTSPGGVGFNEIRFEDRKGDEQIFVHAEKDWDQRVKNDSRELIGANRHLIVGDKRQEKVATQDLLEVGEEIHVKSGTKIIVEAGDHISLKGPGGFIHIGPGGITIDGTMVWINSGGPGPGTGTGAKPDEADNAETGHKSAP